MAILDETSYLATYVGRVLYTAIVVGAFDSNEEVKFGVAGVMGISSAPIADAAGCGHRRHEGPS